MTSVPDQAEIHRLSISRIRGDRMDAAKLFCEHFFSLPDKSGGWHDIVRLAYDEDNDVRLNAVVALISAFVQVPDKAQAGHDLHSLIQDENGYIVFREMVSREAYTQDLIEIFCLIPNKNEAWQDLHKLTKDDSGQVRFIAAYILSDFFSLAPNKVEAWQDLRRLLIQHNDFRDIAITARAIAKNFSYLPDKAQAWQDLVRLAQDQDDHFLLSGAAEVLCAVSVQVPDKDQVWQDLVRLAHCGGAGSLQGSIQGAAASALGSAFAYVSDKELAWKDLVKLTENQYRFTRPYAAKALGRAFTHVQDKNEAWSILYKLAHDSDYIVKSMAAYAIGSAFSGIPDKSGAWGDLIKLTQDENQFVRMDAYHSLGRVCIFKATAAKDNGTLKSELVDAINYFDKSSRESEHSPARFCYPFYRSYYAIIFQDAKEDEVQRYLAEAREAAGGSKGKDVLLNAVGNLSEALRRSQSMKTKSVEEIASELDTYLWYCDKAAEYMSAAEDEAPGAVRLMRKCNPLLEERIQATIAEIQEKAKQIYHITSGSGMEFKAPGAEIHQAAAGLSGDLVSIQRSSSSIVKQLKKFCMYLPEKEKDQVCKDVEEIESEADFPEKLHLIERALFNLEPILKSHQNPLVDVVILTVLPEEYNQVLAKLSSLGLPLNMATNPNIYAWRFGEAFCPIHNRAYKVAVGMIGRAGDIQSALAAKDAISLWRPNYLVFSGIAGGLPDSGLNKGDVIIADCIYGYEYGKIKEKFDTRGNWTFKTDQGLLNGATAYSLQKGWRDHIKLKPPEECEPKVVSGEIASGEKVIDDPSNDFFMQIKNLRPSVKAVEMEGAGIGSAIEHAQSQLSSVGFMDPCHIRSAPS